MVGTVWLGPPRLPPEDDSCTDSSDGDEDGQLPAVLADSAPALPATDPPRVWRGREMLNTATRLSCTEVYRLSRAEACELRDKVRRQSCINAYLRHPSRRCFSYTDAIARQQPSEEQFIRLDGETVAEDVMGRPFTEQTFRRHRLCAVRAIEEGLKGAAARMAWARMTRRLVKVSEFNAALRLTFQLRTRNCTKATALKKARDYGLKDAHVGMSRSAILISVNNLPRTARTRASAERWRKIMPMILRQVVADEMEAMVRLFYDWLARPPPAGNDPHASSGLLRAPPAHTAWPDRGLASGEAPRLHCLDAFDCRYSPQNWSVPRLFGSTDHRLLPRSSWDASMKPPASLPPDGTTAEADSNQFSTSRYMCGRSRVSAATAPFSADALWALALGSAAGDSPTPQLADLDSLPGAASTGVAMSKQAPAVSRRPLLDFGPLYLKVGETAHGDIENEFGWSMEEVLILPCQTVAAALGQARLRWAPPQGRKPATAASLARPRAVKAAVRRSIINAQGHPRSDKRPLIASRAAEQRNRPENAQRGKAAVKPESRPQTGAPSASRGIFQHGLSTAAAAGRFGARGGSSSRVSVDRKEVEASHHRTGREGKQGNAESAKPLEGSPVVAASRNARMLPSKQMPGSHLAITDGDLPSRRLRALCDWERPDDVEVELAARLQRLCEEGTEEGSASPKQSDRYRKSQDLRLRKSASRSRPLRSGPLAEAVRSPSIGMSRQPGDQADALVVIHRTT
eukprot:jgi/Tetstr1/441396/TSEL_029644.t1